MVNQSVEAMGNPTLFYSSILTCTESQSGILPLPYGNLGKLSTPGNNAASLKAVISLSFEVWTFLMVYCEHRSTSGSLGGSRVPDNT